MKRIFFIAGFFLLSCSGKKELYDVVRKIPRQSYTPPGTVWLRDNLYIDETEISNFSWQEFLYWTGKYEPAKYNSILPDTLCWTRSDVGEAHDLINYYLRLPYCRNYPVVGISYEQAMTYCSWRTDLVNVILYMVAEKLKYNPDSISAFIKRAPKRVVYRLPTKEEWEYAAAAGLDFCNYPMGYERLTDRNNFPVSNTLEYYNYHNKDYVATSMGCSDTLLLDLPTENVFFGKCNKYGLYNMLGNVSEIIADSMVKGISYSSPVYAITREEDPDTRAFSIRSQTYSYRLDQPYKRPEPWIGFRCVAEVLDK